MARWQRAYYIGMALAIVLFVAGELIWLPDPVRLEAGFFWIDTLDLLVYALALIPMLWAGAALVGIAAAWREIRNGRGDASGWPASRSALRPLLRRTAVFMAGAASAAAIMIEPKQLLISAGTFGVAWLLVFADLLFTERSRRKVPVRTICGLSAMLALLLVLFCPTSYMVTYPGLTMNMDRYARVQGGSPHGLIAGVLVFERPAFPVDWLYARLFPHYTFEPMENLGMSIGDYDQQARSMKEDANAAGSAVAFHKLGQGSGITSHGVRITAIVKTSPAKDVLKAGDVIVAVNGRSVLSVRELTDQMASVKPGGQVELSVLRDGKAETVKAGTYANPDDPKKAAFGIQVSDELSFDIPGKVAFHNYLLHEGGPSHGAMLALAIIDQLTPCGITGGNRVAGTGTIEPGGLVGPIGGAEQKAYTVYRSGADVFFVPADNEAEARRGAPKLQIVPVRTLDDILQWLEKHPKPGYERKC